MEILVLHPGALGDIILSLPALRLLRRHFCGARITFAGNLDFIEVVDGSCCDRKSSLSALPLHRLYSDGPLPADDRLKFYDRILAWTGSGDQRFERNLRSISSHVIVASWKPGAGETRHVSTIFADSLAPWISTRSAVEPATIVPEAERERQGKEWLLRHGIRAGAKVVAIHPGAGSQAKRWPRDRFAAIALILSTRHAIQPVIVEGPAEPGIAMDLRQESPALTCPVAAGLSLPVLTGILRHCDVFVGNDSGISHLAAGLGLPSLLIFGPTNPELWAPLGHRVKVLRNCSGCSACAGLAPTHTCLENIRADSVAEGVSIMTR